MNNIINTRIKKKRIDKGLTLEEVQKISFEYFNEAINKDFLQKVEKGIFKNLELWTLYRLSSVLETDIFFSDSNKFLIVLDNGISTNISTNLLFSRKYTIDNRGHNVKEQFLELLGNRIREFRVLACLTQNEFSNLAGVSISTLQRIEQGKVSSKLSTIIRLMHLIEKIRN